MTITAPDVNGSSELCFLFFSSGSLMWRCRTERGLQLKHTIRGEGFLEEQAEFGERGSRIKMGMTFAISGGLLYASH